MFAPSTIPALHTRATQLLGLKLRHVPAAMFPNRRKPSITDIFTNADALWNLRLPANCQLDYVFTHHNDFAAAHWWARRTEQDVGVTLAIWTS